METHLHFQSILPWCDRRLHGDTSFPHVSTFSEASRLNFLVIWQLWKDHPSCNALKEKWRTICSWGLGVHVGVEIDSVKKEVIWLDLFFPNSVS